MHAGGLYSHLHVYPKTTCLLALDCAGLCNAAYCCLQTSPLAIGHSNRPPFTTTVCSVCVDPTEHRSLIDATADPKADAASAVCGLDTVAVIETPVAARALGSQVADTRNAPLARSVVNAAGSAAGQAGKR